MIDSKELESAGAAADGRDRAPMLYNLQVLRAVAAYMAFFHHFSVHLRPIFGDRGAIGIGAAGVDIFFVISGFIMVATTTGRAVAPIDFLLRRVARLVPIYWFVTLLVVALVLVGFRPIGVLAVHPGDLLQSLLFLPFLRGPFIEPIVSVGWTLDYEMFFYVIFAGLLLVRSEGLRIAGLVAVLVGLALASLAGPAGFYLQFYTRPIVIDFALGALLGYVLLRLLDRCFGAVRAGFGYGSIAAGTAMLAASEVVAHRWSLTIELLPFWRLLFWGSAALLIVGGALVLERSGRIWRSPFLIGQGNASYSIYLIHNLFLHAASKVAVLVGAGAIAGAGITFGLAFGATAILGVQLHRRIERPLNEALRTAVLALRPRNGQVRGAIAAALRRPATPFHGR